MHPGRLSMCDEYWERELARRMRMLAEEAELISLDTVEPEGSDTDEEALGLPTLLSIEEKKRAPRVLAR